MASPAVMAGGAVTAAAPQNCINLVCWCPASVGVACAVVNTNGVAPGAIDAIGGVVNVTSVQFIAQGRAAIFVAGTIDVWTINNNKNLVNAQNGIP